MAIIKADGVSIRYIIGDFKDIGLKDYVVRKLSGKYHVEEFWADKDVSFELEAGDMLGIIGSNGAGKSTLLKAVSGIMIPTRGHMEANGSIAALLELTSGFDWDSTVKENTYLRGAMLGYTREFMDEKYDEIIEFAELENFQDRAFKQLSSGMQSRLAFSIACLVQPDIIILDEVLSVGDGAFRQKSGDKMREILQNGVTGILVSHSVAQVRDLCNKILWLDHGNQVAFSDDVTLYCDAYEEFLATKDLPQTEEDVIRLANDHKERVKSDFEKKNRSESQRLQAILSTASSSAALEAALATIANKDASLLTEAAKEKAKEIPPLEEEEVGQKVTPKSFFEREKIRRIFGENRYETSLVIATSLKKMLGVRQFDNIVVASGDTSQDALAGAYLANKLHAPIVLIESCSDNANVTLNQDVIDYIGNNIKSSGKLYLLGSTATISSLFEDVMRMELGDERVVRIFGNTLYDTNVEILNAAEVMDEELFVCNVHDFVTATSISALGKPLLLVGNGDELNDSQKEFLSGIKCSAIYAVGDVSDGLIELLNEIKPTASIEKIEGENIYETSSLIAKRFIDDNNTMVVATGVNFPDGLCAGPLAYALGAPIILTRNKDENEDYKYMKAYKDEKDIENILILGGFEAINSDLVEELK